MCKAFSCLVMRSSKVYWKAVEEGRKEELERIIEIINNNSRVYNPRGDRLLSIEGWEQIRNVKFEYQPGC